jgi:hypothetical protein
MGVAAKPGKPIAAIEPKGHSGPNIGHGPTNNPLGTPPSAPSGKTIEEKRLPAGGTGRKPPGGQVPEEKKVQSQTVPHPPTPQVAHPPPPPKPHVAPPPPPPPKRPPPPAPPKPKCEPGKPCH